MEGIFAQLVQHGQNAAACIERRPFGIRTQVGDQRWVIRYAAIDEDAVTDHFIPPLFPMCKLVISSFVGWAKACLPDCKLLIAALYMMQMHYTLKVVIATTEPIVSVLYAYNTYIYLRVYA